MNMSARLPMIGISTRHGDDAWVSRNVQNYRDAVTKFGGVPVMLAPDIPVRLPGGHTFSPDDQGRLPEQVLDHLDGLILAGGGDVHPRYFAAEIAGADPEAIDVKRDELELTLARAALQRDLPLLGICRGCQVLNVAAGGGLVQDFPGHRSNGDTASYHDVLVEPTSRVYTILGEVRLPVNTYHHQGVDSLSLAPMLVPAAVADPDQWLIEAIESARHRWVVGVQWHPERLAELAPQHVRLWESFLAACRRDETGFPDAHRVVRL